MWSWQCPECGHTIDTPMHELGCEAGREGRIRITSEGAKVISREEQAREREGDRIVQLQNELAEVSARYRQLQASTGAALVRAHLMRGDAETDAGESKDEVARLRDMLQLVCDAGWPIFAYATGATEFTDEEFVAKLDHFSAQLEFVSGYLDTVG
jgi:hypothetical protein